MTESILLEDLIDVFVAAVKAKRPRIEISRKYNQLTPFLGPIELHGLMEPYTLMYLRKRWRI